ncbi:hypothetical protein [Paenibacillus wynnii]|uniref:hypothetical protein n=1 Tax=Paenibacillus wynnii TaxID=268407 RepID=UPI00278EC906|nr:hypothetical protein [Paenibacillus wynnii]MDQ0194210.1 hypothetical protein [Paenibacillus wynnii]
MMEEKQLLISKIRSMESRYNPQLHLLRSRFSSPGYHTTLTEREWVHSTRDSLNYALGLLDTELKQYEQRALEVISRVAALQDTDRSHDTFGIWSWFYEEPLKQMAPPDWNWADFCGSKLLTALCRHGHRFPEKLRQAVISSVSYACEAIQKRNVGPDYTNIAILGAFVTLIYGERFGHGEFAAYGLDRLTRLYEYTSRREVFEEYNSPVYTYIAILELSKLRGMTRNAEARGLCNKLLDMTWKTVAGHYHVDTKQWSGPHARCYETLLNDQSKAFLQIATQGEAMFFPWADLPYEEEWYLSGMVCSPQYLEAFSALDTRLVTQWYQGDMASSTARWATTYITQQYSLGTFDHMDFWNQRRVLLAYVNNGGQPAYLRLRFLHDGYDYCSAYFKSRQQRDRVWFGIDFVSNGGDTHINLDKICGSIQASDLRLRLELGGNLEGVSITQVRDGAVIEIGGLFVSLKSWLILFAETTGSGNSFGWEIAETESGAAVDLVLYSGPQKPFDFAGMNQALLVLSLTLGMEPEAHGPAPVIEMEDNRVKVAHGDIAEQQPLYLNLRPAEI